MELLNNLKEGDRVKITHSRKGTFDAEVSQIMPDSEFFTVVVLEKVKGLVNQWLPGESLGVRKSLITDIKKLD